MATVRKRTWTYKGERHTAWVVNYADQNGKRRLKTFGNKKAADAWLVGAAHEVKQGTHTADSESITIADACELWIERGERERLERSTVRQYRQHAPAHSRGGLVSDAAETSSPRRDQPNVRVLASQPGDDLGAAGHRFSRGAGDLMASQLYSLGH